MSKTEQVIQVLMQMSVDDIRSIVTDINNTNGNLYHLQVNCMDDFNEILQGYTPMEIADKIYFGDFNPNDSYFRFDDIENLESFDEYEIAEFYKTNIEEIAEQIIEWHEYIRFSIEIEKIFEGEE